MTGFSLVPAVVTLAALLATGSAVSDSARPPRPAPASLQAPSQTDAEHLRATERERLRALVTADLPVARRLHADDFQLINPSGGALSKEQYLGGIASGVLDYLVWEPDSIAVRLYGQAAIIRYQARLEIVVQGQHHPLRRYWHTDAYERREGRWQVVWSQATEIK